MKIKLKGSGIPPGLCLAVHDQTDLVSDTIEREGIWEAFETQLLFRHLQAGQVFVDVGANIGYYSLLAAHIVGAKGRVFAFEPELQNAELFKKNCQGLANVEFRLAGLSDSSCRKPLYLSEDNFGDHRLSDEGGRNSQWVDLIAGDELLAGLEIDFVKVDTQGAEFHVIKGLSETLFANRSHLTMVLEFWPFGLEAAGSSARELVELLAPLQLNVSLIDHENRRLVASDYKALIRMAEGDILPPEKRGFINLFLSPSA